MCMTICMTVHDVVHLLGASTLKTCAWGRQLVEHDVYILHALRSLGSGYGMVFVKFKFYAIVLQSFIEV